MENIGICDHSGRVYAGSNNASFPLDPTVSILPMAFQTEDSAHQQVNQMLFREDFFDPITKIRKGRVYVSPQKDYKATWYVQDPMRNDLERCAYNKGTAQMIELSVYIASPLSELATLTKFPDVILGSGSYVTRWRILSIENTHNGKPLLTIKSFRSFGVVPRLKKNEIPDEVFPKLQGYLDIVEESSNRFGPASVVDRCRDALAYTFSVQCGDPKKDLMNAINGYQQQLSDRKDNQITWSGRIVARLHAMAKPSEKESKGYRELTEEDAQLALRLLWHVLVQMGWAEPYV